MPAPLKRIAFVLFIGISSLLVTGIASCRKYKNGPWIAFHSKSDRVANLWVIDKYLEDGNNLTDVYFKTHTEFVWRFSKDGSFDIYGKIVNHPWSRSGEWKFIESKTSIEMLNQASDCTYVYRIMKLESNHLWLLQEDTATQVKTMIRLKTKK